MFYPFRFLSLLSALLLPLPPAFAASAPEPGGDTVGVRRVAAPSRERGRDLEVMVWYPAQAGGDAVTLGESVFFEGTPARRDAPISAGRYPLVLVSHGAGLAGHPQAISWIAAPLARQGYVVAAPMHPGNSGGNRSAAETMKIWLRPGDISATLTALDTDAAFREHLEPQAVGVLGLSMGGGTALALAGARLAPARLAAYCDTDALNPSLCGWIRQSGVDLHGMDMGAAGRDNQDRRIRFAMAIDPAPIDVFAADSFSRVSIPVALVNLGRPDTIPATAQASGVAGAIPGATYAAVEDASHFSLFAECKPGAASIAEAEQIGDPICIDGGRRSRRDLHAQLIEMTLTAFDRALKTAR